MKYKTKSAIIGRKKREKADDISCPCFISLFSMNNPHISGKVPDKILEYRKIHKIIITGLNINYLLGGNDLVINDLAEIEVMHDGGHINITGKQKKTL
jgi:hypothetical protein